MIPLSNLPSHNFRPVDLKIPENRRPINGPSHPAPFTFFHFSHEKQGCGSEARALGAKSIGGKSIPDGERIVFPQNEAGQLGARPGAPTTESPFFCESTACPPRLQNDFCLMVFAPNGLASEPGNGCKAIELWNTCRKVGGKPGPSFACLFPFFLVYCGRGFLKISLYCLGFGKEIFLDDKK